MGWLSRETRLQKTLERVLEQRLVAFDRDIAELRRKADLPAEGQQRHEPAVLLMWGYLLALRSGEVEKDAVLRLTETCQGWAATHVAHRIAPGARGPEQMTPSQRSLFHLVVVTMPGRVDQYDEAFERGRIAAFTGGSMQMMGPLLTAFARNLVAEADFPHFQDRTQAALAQRVDRLLRDADTDLA